MLSHHELATLMLLRDTGRHLEERDPDVLALRHYQLIEVRQHERQGATLQLHPPWPRIIAAFVSRSGRIAINAVAVPFC